MNSLIIYMGASGFIWLQQKWTKSCRATAPCWRLTSLHVSTHKPCKQDWTAADMAECLWVSQNTWRFMSCCYMAISHSPLYVPRRVSWSSFASPPGFWWVWEGFVPCPHPLLRAQLQPIKLVSSSVALASQQQAVPSFVWQSAGLWCFGVAMPKGHRELAPLHTIPFAVCISNKLSES